MTTRFTPDELGVDPRARAARTAREWLSADPLFLDTETTGLNGQVEIAVLDRDGAVRLKTLVQPLVPLQAEAVALHGITEPMVRDQPRFDAVWPRLRNLIRGRTVVVYNADCDRWRLIDSARDAGYATFAGTLAFAGPRSFQEEESSDVPTWLCAMRLYAEFYGEWNNNYRRNYKWQSLENAARQCGLAVPPGLHRARMDAELCRQVVLAMAQNRGNDG